MDLIILMLILFIFFILSFASFVGFDGFVLILILVGRSSLGTDRKVDPLGVFLEWWLCLQAY